MNWTTESLARILRPLPGSLGPVAAADIDHVLASDCFGPDGEKRLYHQSLDDAMAALTDESTGWPLATVVAVDCGRPVDVSAKLDSAREMAAQCLEMVCENDELCPHDPEDPGCLGWVPWPELIAAFEAVRKELARTVRPYYRDCRTVLVDVAAWKREVPDGE